MILSWNNFTIFSTFGVNKFKDILVVLIEKVFIVNFFTKYIHRLL